MSENPVAKIVLSIFCFCLLIECKSSLADKTNKDRIIEGKQDSTILTKKEPWYEKNQLSTADQIYKPNIKTVILHNTGLELNEPVILLNGNQTVTLHFDDLDGYLKDYSYSIIHCTKNWENSGMTETEYMQGFFVNPITDYAVSFNTYQKYINYTLTFPNEDLKILRSGNYLLQVFSTNDTEDIILTRRFMVYENKCQIKPIVKSPSDLNERYYKQEIDFSIFPTDISTSNQFDVYIKQNSRWDNMKSGFSPIFVRDNELVYDLDQPDIFNGGNEFRYFDIRSVTYTTERVIKVEKTDSLFEATLSNEFSRGFKKYVTYQDIDGKFKIENSLTPDEDYHTEADYVWVNFTLEAETPFIDGTLYIFGALSQWNFLPDFLLQYDETKKCYEKRVLLKQGYYNYQYVQLKDNLKAGNEIIVEGDHFETENSYSIFVYFKDITGNYDRLIGYKPFTSINY